MEHNKLLKKDWSELQIKRVKSLTQRFNRWHDKQIGLLTFSINLYITICIAILGFILNDRANLFKSSTIYGLSLGKTVGIIIFLSLMFGILALISRLNDFKATKDLIKWRKYNYLISENLKYEFKKELTKDCIEKKINYRKRLSEIFGKTTWWLFYFQIVMFLAGVLIIVFNI